MHANDKENRLRAKPQTLAIFCDLWAVAVERFEPAGKPHLGHTVEVGVADMLQDW